MRDLLDQASAHFPRPPPADDADADRPGFGPDRGRPSRRWLTRRCSFPTWGVWLVPIVLRPPARLPACPGFAAVPRAALSPFASVRVGVGVIPLRAPTGALIGESSTAGLTEVPATHLARDDALHPVAHREPELRGDGQVGAFPVREEPRGVLAQATEQRPYQLPPPSPG